MGKTFSIADAFQNVPDPGTDREQITYIAADLLIGDEQNFYSMSALDDLAANIQLVGLQQPIRVRPDGNGRYIIVSGHRRRAAIEQLRGEEPERWAEIPCIIEDNAQESDAMRELRLIFANMDTRKMSGADIDRQAQRVQELLYQLKEEGVEFPGRMRDHVAEACKVSKSKLSRLKVIREGLEPGIAKKYWETGKQGCLNESAAYELARLPHGLQKEIIDKYLHRKDYYGHGVMYLYGESVKKIGERITKLEKQTCRLGGPCDNMARKRENIISILVQSSWSATYCESTCCGKCPNLERCKDVCAHQISAQKQLKQQKRDANAAAKAEAAKKAAPKIERLEELWERFGTARSRAGISPDDYKRALECNYMGLSDNDFQAYESGYKINENTCLPLGYNFTLTDAERLVAAADALGVSLDYLFCRSKDPRIFEDAASAMPTGQMVFSGWMPGGTNPGHSCECVVDFIFDDEKDGLSLRRIVDWNAIMGRWEFSNGAAIDAAPVRWMELPDIPEDVEND